MTKSYFTVWIYTTFWVPIHLLMDHRFLFPLYFLKLTLLIMLRYVMIPNVTGEKAHSCSLYQNLFICTLDGHLQTVDPHIEAGWPLVKNMRLLGQTAWFEFWFLPLILKTALSSTFLSLSVHIFKMGIIPSPLYGRDRPSALSYHPHFQSDKAPFFGETWLPGMKVVLPRSSVVRYGLVSTSGQWYASKSII